MGNLIQNCIRRYSIIILSIVTTLLIIGVISAWDKKNNDFDERGARVKINEIISQIEADNSDISTITFDLPFCLINGQGEIVAGNMDRFSIGDCVDVHTLGGSRQYIVPVRSHTSGYDLLLVDCTDYSNSKSNRQFVMITVTSSLLWALIVLMIIHINKVLRKDVFGPVKDINKSTRDILIGNLKTPVKYDYDGEIGSLCHDFENMRDELSDSFDRELQLKERIHVMYASISHDLKTPLATITGYVEGILYDVVQSPEEIKLYAERMLNKSQVLNKLIDDILESSKAELNQLSIKTQEVYSRQYFGEVLENYLRDSIQNNYSFSYTLPEDFIIELDPARIAEVFQNLIGNAIKYGKKSVHIDVSFEQYKEKSTMLLVKIKDNGPGIDAAELPFIFDIFYRGNKARTQDIPGSGLGLNISRFIVEKHGGQIECDSIVGVGTTMTFSIPVK